MPTQAELDAEAVSLVTHPSGVQGYIMMEYLYIHTRIRVPIHTERTVLHPQRARHCRRVGRSSSKMCQLRLLTRCSVCSAHTYWRGQGGYAHLNEHCTRRCQPWQVMRSVRSV